MPRLRFRLLNAAAFVAVLALAHLSYAADTMPAQAAGATVPAPLPQPATPGAYQLDPNHASITFKISHLGFSRYTGRFDKMEGTLNFDANAPEKSALDVTIYPNSVDTNNVKLEEELRGDKFFDVIKWPRATFQSTKIERTGPTTGKVTGDLTFMGATHPVTLDVTMIGSGVHPMTKKAAVGFSATGTIHRSDFGLTNLLPMVGDDVTLEIEAEFDQAG
ncbi:MAG: YceI family protein [Pseudomonadota bacterium]|nr:YceI family protein [Pseudomonadota bacterium]